MRPMRAEGLSRLAAGGGSLALAAVLALAMAAPGEALADVRRTDTVVSATVGERDLPAASCPSIDAEFAVLMDGDGTTLFSRNPLERTHIASITKIMAAIVAIEEGSLDQEVVVSAEAASIGESTAGFQAGDRMTLESALKGMLVPSGNDAAQAIAESLGASMATEGQEPDEAFVARMNERAAELGMANTLFDNAHGLDDDGYEGEMYSTAADVAIMSRKAMESEVLRDIVDEAEAVVEVERDGEKAQVEFVTTDELLGVYEGACGIKTGTTDQAGPSFAGTCRRGDVSLFAIVLNSSSEAQRFYDAQALYNWYFESMVDYKLAHSDERASLDGRDVPVVAHVAAGSWPDKTVAATLADPDASVRVFVPRGNVSQEFDLGDAMGAIHAGDVLGQVRFYQANELIATQDVVACEDLEAPGVLDNIGIAWDRFWGSLSGQSGVADSRVVNEMPLVIDRETTVG